MTRPRLKSFSITVGGLQRMVIVVGISLMAAVALHPPWIARAALTRMSFRGFPRVPPTFVLDSVAWSVPFAPIYSPPSLDIPARELATYQARLMAGDTSAGTDWQRKSEAIERRYRVPRELRSVWRRDVNRGGSPGVAFTSSIVSTRFEIDRVRLGIYLLALGIATGVMLAPSIHGRRRGHWH